MTLRPDAASLTGKVAVITGGGAGLGKGIAAGLAAFGAEVAIWERDAATCASAAEAVGGLAVVTDVRESDQVDRAVAATLERYGHIDVLVNNAGGVFPSSLLEVSENGIDALYRANLRHVIVCTQRVGRTMVAAGQGGSMINVASIEGVRAAPGYAAYAAAKAGVLNFTRTAALELAPHGIRVNALAPDITWTEGLAALAAGTGDARSVEERKARTALVVPMGRLGHVDEVAGAALFLASDLSAYVTGQTLHVDGGTAAAGGWYHHPDSGDYMLGAP